LLVEPITDVVGAPLPRLFGLPGRLAQENAGRNPRRTAATAAALMVGLALVCGVTVMAASIKASVGDRIDKALGADYILTSKQFSGFSTDVADELRDKPGIASVTSVRDGDWKLGDERKSLTSIDPPAVDHLVNLKVQSGSAASLGHGDVLVRKQEAKARHFNVGDVITMVFARSGAQRVRIGGIYKDAVLGEGSYVVSNAFYEANYSTVLDDAVLVKAASGVPLDRARASVDDVVRAFPSVKAEDHAEFKATQRSHVNQLLGLIYVLLALSVLIAVIGIVNTLALSILERTRELGLLRAVGMSRRQVRRMVRWESVLIALLGALLGVVLGIVFGLLIVSTLGDRGITHPTVPVGSLIGFMVFAAAMGVVAAILPARRASRLNILEAIASE
jgi:putative ABC transport system permease protein